MSTLRDKAEQAVEQVLSQVNSLEHLLHDTGDGAPLQGQVRTAMPQLLEFGGSCRLLAVLPQASVDPAAAERVKDALRGDTATVVGCDNSFILCVEAQELSMAHVAVSLVHRRRDYVEFAERVRSRSDISWTKITDRLAPSKPQPAPPVPVAAALPMRSSPPVTTTQLIS
jgi:hypothetical protein